MHRRHAVTSEQCRESEPSGAGVCAGCGANLAGSYFSFVTPEGSVIMCGRCALRHRPLVRNGLKTAAFVGTVLTVINQGNVIIADRLTVGTAVRIVLTYFVPYAVAMYGALSVSRRPLSQRK